MIAEQVRTAGQLEARLRRHYIKPGDMPGGVFLPEVGLNGVVARRCDAIYVGFTSSSGRALIGHELKVSRADWRHELDQPDKADLWADQCHAWYVVAPSTDVVPVEELPDGWGLMIPSARTVTRMDIKVKARFHGDRTPSWLIMRSIMARLDTLQRAERLEVRREEEAKARAAFEERGRQRQMSADPELAAAKSKLDQIEALTGLKLDVRGLRDLTTYANPQQFAEALAIVKARDDLTRRYQGLDTQARDLRTAADRLDELHKLVTA